MSGLHIGTPAADRRRRFDLPEDLVTQTMAVLGIRGSGKTVTANVIAEELLARGHQVVIIDPTDVWWGLKSSGDGTEEGYPVVVMGGDHGDLPLKAEDGRVLADFVVERRVSMVLSLRHLRKSKQRTFVTDFAEQLYHRKGEVEHRTPLLTIVDEASTFIPQRVTGGEARMVGAMEDIVRRGRNAGLGLCAVDQRPASVNKDVLTQIEVLVCHRITGPQDRSAVDLWVRQHDSEGHREAFLNQLASLGTGEAWFWSPALDVFELVQVRMRHTYDSSQTPKRGEQLRAPEKVAEIDLDTLRDQLQETIEEAEANDPKALKKRIEELERQLSAVPESVPTVDVEAVRKELHEELLEEFTEDLHEKLSEAIQAGVEHTAIKTSGPLAHLGDLIAKARDATEAVEAAAEDLAETLAGVVNDPPMPEDLDVGGFTPLPRARREAAKPRAPISRASAQVVRAPVTAEDVSTPQQRILNSLATYESFGKGQVEKDAAAALAGYSPGSGHVNNVFGQMNAADLVDYPQPGWVALTEAGRARAEALPVKELADVHRIWMGLLNEPQQKLLEVLLKVYPGAIRKDDLAEASGYQPGSGHFNNICGSLRKVKAAAYPKPGWMIATDLLFPEGVRP